MSRTLLFLSVLVLLTPVRYSYAQYGETESAEKESSPEEGITNPEEGAGAPVVIEQQPYEYYYWPEENLDNFGLSTLGRGQGGSTLGRDLRRKSNLEVNSPKEPPGEEGDADDESEDTESGTMLYPPEEAADDSGAINNEAPEPSPKESEFYEWVDEKGNVHITNNIGDVPLEYQKEIYDGKSSPE